MQGHIWHQGFQSGALQAKLFPDVLPALQHWKRQGVKTYIYSSGSRQAQRDLFSHTANGDVRQLLAGFFDTVIGAKVRSAAAPSSCCSHVCLCWSCAVMGVI